MTDRIVPKRSGREQIHYMGMQLGLFEQVIVHAVFVFVFAFPAMRAGEGSNDLDVIRFPLVKTFL